MSTARSVATVDLPCTGCGARDDAQLWSGVEHEYDDTTRDEFAVVRCRGCGLVRLNPRPDVSELGQIYSPSYYAYHLVDAKPSRLTEPLKRRLYQRRLQAVVDRAGLREQPRIRLLDVGCADGRLLSWYAGAGALGARLETHGIDMDAGSVAKAQARGHRAVVGRFEDDSELEAGSFDLILASHVIEHVADPTAFARRAAELLAPGGLFVAATPNVDSWDARHFTKSWGGNHFPRHWTLYDAASIRALADSAGLEVVSVDYEVNPIFWTWTLHSWLRRRLPRATWPDKVFPTVGIFQPGPWSFVLLSVFTVVDLVQQRLTGRTASMAVSMRRS